jgi:hypothetical protein
LNLNEFVIPKTLLRKSLTNKLEPLVNPRRFAVWTQLNINLQGKPFSFEGHAYLRELYADPQPRVVIRKAAQMGGSTYALARTLYTAISLRARCLYYLPTDAEAALFSNDRLGTWLDESFRLGRWVKREGEIWRAGSGRVLFRGLFAEMRARAIDADMLVLDELDMLSPARRTQALDRLLHSSLGYVLELSTPKLPATGIDARFAETDMCYWLIKCAGCGWEEPLEHSFPACVGRTGGTARLVCPRCGHGLDAQAGRWVAQKPDVKGTRGYQFCQLHSSVLDLGQILREWEKLRHPYERERFHNSILGLPYSGASAVLDIKTIESCMVGEKPSSEQALWAGVDVGDVLHLAIGTNHGGKVAIVHLARTSDWDELGRLLVKYGSPVTVIDAMPYKASVKQLARNYPTGRMILSYYGGGGRQMGSEDGLPTIRSDRTELLDELVGRVETGALELPSCDEECWLAARHLAGLRRVVEEGRDGRRRMIYPRGGEDHYAHALAYLLLAAWCLPASDSVFDPATVPRNIFPCPDH